MNTKKIKKFFKLTWFYLNLPSMIVSRRLSKELIGQIANHEFFSRHYRLIDDEGNKIQNPRLINNTSLELLIPIPEDVLKIMDTYVKDQRSPLDGTIYEAGVGFMFDVKVEEYYSKSEDESKDDTLIVSIIWSIKNSYLYKSIMLTSSILTLIGMVLYFFLK